MARSECNITSDCYIASGSAYPDSKAILKLIKNMIMEFYNFKFNEKEIIIGIGNRNWNDIFNSLNLN